MTRINAGVRANELVDRHLLAEHREIKRIPRAVSQGKYKLNGAPQNFRLGPGHVKFFYDKCKYLLNRYIEIREECIRRGFKVQDWSSAWNPVPPELMNDWQETLEAREEVLTRVNERLRSMS